MTSSTTGRLGPLFRVRLVGVGLMVVLTVGAALLTRELPWIVAGTVAVVVLAVMLVRLRASLRPA